MDSSRSSASTIAKSFAGSWHRPQHGHCGGSDRGSILASAPCPRAIRRRERQLRWLAAPHRYRKCCDRPPPPFAQRNPAAGGFARDRIVTVARQTELRRHIRSAIAKLSPNVRSAVLLALVEAEPYEGNRQRAGNLRERRKGPRLPWRSNFAKRIIETRSPFMNDRELAETKNSCSRFCLRGVKPNFAATSGLPCCSASTSIPFACRGGTGRCLPAPSRCFAFFRERFLRCSITCSAHSAKEKI